METIFKFLANRAYNYVQFVNGVLIVNGNMQIIINYDTHVISFLHNGELIRSITSDIDVYYKHILLSMFENEFVYAERWSFVYSELCSYIYRKIKNYPEEEYRIVKYNRDTFILENKYFETLKVTIDFLTRRISETR